MTVAAVLLLVREAVRVVVPLVCAGCGAADHVLCPDCAGQLGAERLDQHAPALDGAFQVWGLGSYEGSLRRTVLAWKTGGRRDVERSLLVGLAGVTQALLAGRLGPGSPGLVLAGRPLVVVPAPSGPWRWLRGRPAVLRLCRAVARAAAEAGNDAVVVAALGSMQRSEGGRHGAGRAGSGHGAGVGAGVGGGGRGRRGSESVRRGGRRVRSRLSLEGASVLLVDDVLTTGATLAACRDAVEGAGGRVVGAVVLAGAKVRGRQR